MVTTRGGVVHTELYVRMPAHLSQNSVLSIIYGPAMDEFARPRQLSFLLDMVDAYFILFCVRLGVPHFLSVIHYLFVSLIGLVSWTFFTRTLQVQKLLALLLVGIFYTASPVIFGYYFRTAKIGAALTTVLLVILIYRAVSARSTGTRRRTWFTGLAIFAAALAATLFDEQGIATVILAFLVSIWLAIAIPGPNRWLAPGSLLISLIAAGTYDFWLFPRISYAFNQVSPTLDYQTGIAFSLPLAASYLSQGWSLLLSTTRFLVGNISEFQGVVLILALLVISFGVPRLLPGKKTIPYRFTPLILTLLLLGGSWLMFALMVARHPPITWPDIRRVYYWLPTTALLFVTLPVLLQPVLAQWQNHHFRFFLVTVILLSFLAGNIYALSEADMTLRQGHMKNMFVMTTQILEGLQNRRNPSYHPPEAVADDPIYQLLNYQILLR